ncbi:nitrilase-related carbon-nitrogen hydrolase [Tengunoibacter tsumagoiensis]|uniref:Amidohydrolase n=1 Tax=Tengunoibacter tsumagoiensis TaxID=2014871 RepID=A0A402A492_9CHLR|nr:nitrilase-related carbon-nitrogen hydrolase [Tengunoibacter tsumagoiensis]GCE13889.1 amidohydrolase [Tengunoibacter tsumagoiensis]
MSVLTTALTTYQVAAIQYEPTLGEKEKNIRDLLSLVEQAIAQGARLIVLPELATTGSCWTSREEIAPYVEAIPGPTTERFQRLAQEFQCIIAVGLPEVDPETQVFYNSAALLGPDGLIGRYRKLHASITDPRWAHDGDLGIPVWETPLGRLSILLGTDAQYFETARIAALHHADVLLFPTNWTLDPAPSTWWLARAFENKVYLIAADRSGQERNIFFQGGSCIIQPDGSVQALLEKGNGIVSGEINLHQSQDKRWLYADRVLGQPLADRQPAVYPGLLNNSYLWEPLRYHSLYALGELPPGQLSCVGIIQMELQIPSEMDQLTQIRHLGEQLRTMMQNNAPACPDVLVLPELVVPGPLPEPGQYTHHEAIIQHFQRGAIQIPGPETDALVALANEWQFSMVVGVAEKVEERYYNTVLLLDPEGIYGSYRKIHLSPMDKLWASKGDLGLPFFDTPAGRIGLATGYDLLFPETLRVLANQGCDLLCAPALLGFPHPFQFPQHLQQAKTFHQFDHHEAPQHLLWRIRAAEQNIYLAIANWYGQQAGISANGLSGIFSPSIGLNPSVEVIADEGELGLMMMTIDTREQKTGRRTTHILEYSPGDMAGSLTGELAYNILDGIPGNLVRSKPMLRRRQPFWYHDLVRRSLP